MAGVEHIELPAAIPAVTRPSVANMIDKAIKEAACTSATIFVWRQRGARARVTINDGWQAKGLDQR
jgi:hypothetical protein